VLQARLENGQSAADGQYSKLKLDDAMRKEYEEIFAKVLSN
jgi:hypothetical protein